ncbi:Retrovirus-related Pol polyprotein from transposon RE1-like protein [Drosera capensis]
MTISTNGLSSQKLQSVRELLSRSTHITICWKKHEYADQSPVPSARQNLLTQVVIGEDREAQGLYHLNASPTSLSALDIKNAFLHGDLAETVYMFQPPRYETAGENHVCCLRKSLYGLKQSPRAWFEKFNKVVYAIGFSRSSADSSLFVHRRSQGTVILLVYVDDIIITGNDTTGIAKLKSHLSKQFHIKDLGTLKYFLGIEIAKQGKSFLQNQRKYCFDLLKESGFLGCKPVDTPMEQNLKLSNFTDEPDFIIPNLDMYRRLVGKLIYLTVTRPDISFAVSLVSQFMYTPRKSYLIVVDHILRYLKKSPGKGLIYRPTAILFLTAYSDADYAGSPDDIRSTSGYCTYFGGNLVT